jgi:fibronectin type 3 domain-containing protein
MSRLIIRNFFMKTNKRFSLVAVSIVLAGLLFGGCTPPPTDTPPLPPEAPVITSGDGQLTVSWPKVEGATSYEVYYGTTNDSTFVNLFGDVPKSTAAIIGLTNGTTYYVWVKSKNAAGTSNFGIPGSGTPNVKPIPPSNLAASEQSSTSIRITWTAVPGAAWYKIYRCATPEGKYQPFVDTIEETSYTDNGLTPDKTYYYKVTAIGASEAESNMPDYAEATTRNVDWIPPPGTPIVTSDNGQLPVSWEKVERATSYEVYYGTTNDSAAAGKYGSDITDPTATITGLTNNTLYYVWVRSKNSYMTSDFSSPATGTPGVVPVHVKDIVAGYYGTFILKEDGSVWATGLNSRGELGTGDTINRSSFTRVIASGVKALGAGRDHSVILKEDGSVWVTGRNDYGQLGTGDTTDQSSFTMVVSSGVKALVTVYYGSFILKEDGSVWATGLNVSGQLGTGDTTNRSSFTRVIASGVKIFAAEKDHSLILKEDGNVYATGTNNYGQLGTGNTTYRTTFAQITVSGVKALAAGYRFSFILKEDGSVWAVGYNEFGQLGTGDTADRSIFTQVPTD